LNDPLGKVFRGMPVGRALSARTWNYLVEAAKRIQEERGEGETPPDDAAIGPSAIRVQNNSGGAVGWYAILSLAGQAPLIDPGANLQEFQQLVDFTGITPTAAGQQFVVVMEPLPNGNTGRAAIAGPVQVQVNVTNAAHTFATTTNGDNTKLTSASDNYTNAGVPILWKQSGTGTKWAVVLLPAILNAQGAAGAVSSVSNSDGTLTISPTTGAVVASIALAHANTWTANQTVKDAVWVANWDGAGASEVVNASFYADNSSESIIQTDLVHAASHYILTAGFAPNYTGGIPTFYLASTIGGVASDTRITLYQGLTARAGATGTLTDGSAVYGGIVYSINNLAGLSVTITTAKLTPGGANGSMTFTNGILTAQTPAT
jgi:hypothetical protein